MANDPQSTTVNLPVDTAVQLHDALGMDGTPTGSPNSNTVSLQLDSDTADKVRSALKDGLNSTVAIAFGEDNPPH